ncbi:MAG: SIR2 family protein, partial [Candidatus Aminicenantes bacterium]|nr:SIR2 family protein [Candidatus Aminicenantes bacterium]
KFADLKEKIEGKIIDIVSVHKAKADFIKDLIHCDFAQWVGQANRKFPVEIFTTNYDYLFEIGLEHHNIPYFDGFMGGFEPFFNSTFVEDLGFLPQITKLWKIHGSLGWDLNENKKKIVRKYHEENNIIVFPSLLKYDDSKKHPYVSYLDRLGKFLKQDDAVLFLCGYSFGDQHINEVVLNALSATRTSHAIVLYYDLSKDKNRNKMYSLIENSPISLLAMSQPKLSVYGFRSAVIGGKFGKWQLKTEPNKDDSILIDYYFDEDAPEDSELELKVEGKEGLKWTGEGEFRLPDFENFVAFLSYLTFENYLQTNIKNEKS